MLVVKRTMKIIHTADWHLGQTFYGFDRSNEHAVFLDWMCSTIKERGATLLLVAGDVFDTPNPSAKAQKMFYSFLTRVTNENPDLQIIITAGNHDSAARIEAPSSMLNVFNVFVSGVRASFCLVRVLCMLTFIFVAIFFQQVHIKHNE